LVVREGAVVHRHPNLVGQEAKRGDRATDFPAEDDSAASGIVAAA
jgi:hypothetical protein